MSLRPSAPLLLLAGLLTVIGLPLPWSTVATADGRVSVSLRGVDYAGYDIATTIVLAILLIAAGFVLASRVRWAHLYAVVVAIMACMWAALVVDAAANPAAADTSVTGVAVTIGAGAYLLGAGAVIALAGALLSLRGRARSEPRPAPGIPR